MIKLTNVPVPLELTEKDLRNAASKKLKMSVSGIESVKLVRKAVDARKKENITFVCTLLVKTENEERLVARLRDNSVSLHVEEEYSLPQAKKLEARPVVVGFGPAGMLAALVLARCGQRPIIFERGEQVEKRRKSVLKFWQERKLNTQSNVQFGEGGAGTFSDGKLTTGTKDIRIGWLLKQFVSFGAPESILVDAKPHVGTDNLTRLVKNLREEIIRLGGEFHFESTVTDVLLEGGRLKALSVEQNGERRDFPCEDVILSVGHSARDTFEMLLNRGVQLEAKPFSVGVRIEHPQEIINKAQYGSSWNSQLLGAADYKLAKRSKAGRGIYTFCMCPGGQVVAAASEENTIVTNGMSEYSRDAENANSAVLVGVSPEDFGKEPLAGVAYQRKIERTAFKLAGEDYTAPAQLVGDFLKGQKTTSFGSVKPSYQPSVKAVELASCFDEAITSSLKEGIVLMGRSLAGFDMNDALLTAPETRSSSPVRILRGESLEAVGLSGVYPCGEGAGYAGGIVSAAVDGMKCAEALMKNRENMR